MPWKELCLKNSSVSTVICVFRPVAIGANSIQVQLTGLRAAIAKTWTTVSPVKSEVHGQSCLLLNSRNSVKQWSRGERFDLHCSTVGALIWDTLVTAPLMRVCCPQTMGGDFQGKEQDCSKGIYCLAGRWIAPLHVRALVCWMTRLYTFAFSV